jgi:hypothetical protein
MKPKMMSEAEIVATAEVIDLSKAKDMDALLLMTFEAARAPSDPRRAHIVRWPDKVSALVIGDPRQKLEWEQLLIRTYMQGYTGQTGPLLAQ